jgi:hypothetical protein
VDRHDAVVLPFLADHCHPLLGRLLRASVGSTEASNGRLARVGRIDEWHKLKRKALLRNGLCS